MSARARLDTLEWLRISTHSNLVVSVGISYDVSGDMRALSACDRYATCGTAVLAERRARASGCSTHLVAAVGQVSGRVLASGLRRTGQLADQS